MRDVEMCSLEELEEELAMLGVTTAVMAGREMVLLAALARRGDYPARGWATLWHWLSWRTGLSPFSAREHVRVAVALDGLPHLLEALCRGEISFSKARAITRIAKPETEQALLEFARAHATAEIERHVRRLRRPTTADAASAEDRRELRVFWGDDGMLVVNGRLTAEQGTLLLKALEASRADLDTFKGSAQAGAMRKADALALIADKSLSVEAGRAQSDRTQVVVHVDAEVLAETQADGRSEIGGVAVSAETARRLSCDCVAVVLAQGERLRDVSVGRRQRIVPPPLRRLIAERQGHRCAFPGCTYEIDTDHHGVHWAQGGGTDTDNCAGVCHFHHKVCHEGGHKMRIVDGRAVFFDPTGKQLPESASQPRPDAEYTERLLSTRMSERVDSWTLAGYPYVFLDEHA